MPRPKSSIEAVESNVGLLKKLDWDRPDKMITKSEFDSKSLSAEELLALSGVASCDSWGEFKVQFIAYQEQLGFIWQRASGQGGPVKLREVVLDNQIGEEMAEREIIKGSKAGNLATLLKKMLPGLVSYMHDPSMKQIDHKLVREGFKDLPTYRRKKLGDQ